MSALAVPTPKPASRLRPLATRSDEALRALAAQGDQAAFAALYERHRAPLYRYCRSIVRHDEDAHDALNTTMANAWAALQKRDRDVPVRPWLFRIAHNEAITLLRRRRPQDELDEAQAVACGGAPHEEFEVRERLDRLRLDLADLPDRQRRALLLRELCGLAHGEIATVLDVTPAVAKQNIYEARVALHAAEAGRHMTCDEVRHTLSDGDGRMGRGRRLKGHLRTCRDCAAFGAALRARPAQLAALFPPLPAALGGAGLLARLLAHLGGAGGAASASGGGIAATLPAAGGGLAAKAAVATLVAASAGGVVIAERADRPTPPSARAVTAAAPVTPAAAPATPVRSTVVRREPRPAPPVIVPARRRPPAAPAAHVARPAHATTTAAPRHPVAPPGQAKRAAVPGQAKRAATPGQAKRAAAPGQTKRAAPPAQAKPVAPPGQVKRAAPPGQAKRSAAPARPAAPSQGGHAPPATPVTVQPTPRPQAARPHALAAPPAPPAEPPGKPPARTPPAG